MKYMGNKLKQIHLANILLEQRYLREQAQTGTTQSSSTPTPPTTGATQTPPPPTEVKPSSQSKPKYTLETLNKMTKEDIESKLLKCSTPNLEKVTTTNGINIHKLEDGVNFCRG